MYVVFAYAVVVVDLAVAAAVYYLGIYSLLFYFFRFYLLYSGCLCIWCYMCVSFSFTFDRTVSRNYLFSLAIIYFPLIFDIAETDTEQENTDFYLFRSRFE